MRKIILILALAVLLSACNRDCIKEQGQTMATTAEKTEVETTASTTAETATETTAAPTDKTHEKPEVFTMDAAFSVEDYFGGDVLYKADFDGDGEKENCIVKIVGHGTQCYVEEIEITRVNGEKIVVEHPVTATGMRSNLYKFQDSYNIYLHAGPEGYTEIVYPFDKLSTAEKNLINPQFGDIFDYSVIGDKLYFRGSIACGFSEVLGDIIYEYTYRDGSLKVSHILYKDYIDGADYDLGDVEPTSSLLVEPCKEDKSDVTLPEGDCLVESHAIMSNPQFLVYEKGLTYYVKQYTSALSEEYTLKKYTLSLPEGYADGVIVSDSPGGGSGELGLAVRAKKGEHEVVLRYLFYADKLMAPVEVWED